MSWRWFAFIIVIEKIHHHHNFFLIIILIFLLIHIFARHTIIIIRFLATIWRPDTYFLHGRSFSFLISLGYNHCNVPVEQNPHGNDTYLRTLFMFIKVQKLFVSSAKK